MHDLLRSDLHWRFLENCIANIGIEHAIVSGNGGDCIGGYSVFFRRVENAPLFLRLSAPGIVAGNFAALECLLLWINAIFNECSLLAANDVAQIWSNCNHA